MDDIVEMIDKAKVEILFAQCEAESLTCRMHEARLRLSEAENRVKYWENRKLQRRLRAALRKKSSSAR